MFDAARTTKTLGGKLEEAAAQVLQSGSFVLGETLNRFEAEFAAFVRSANGIGTASGTDALTIALKAAGIGPGHNVITPANTALPTAMAIVATGARLRFCDVDSDTLLMTPETIESVSENGIDAVVPVHLYGRPAMMPEILVAAQKLGAVVIEDCAQAHGATVRGRHVGTFGAAGAFSFYPTKNLGCAGDGGMIVTADNELAARARMLGNYGQRERDRAEVCGVNSRLDDLQAALLSVKIPFLVQWNRRRRKIAARYDEAFADFPLTLPPQIEGAVVHLYVVRTEKRDTLAQYLQRYGVGTSVHYPRPLHFQKAFAELGYEAGDFPVAEKACAEVLSLPCFPELTDSEIDRVIEAVISFFKGTP